MFVLTKRIDGTGEGAKLYRTKEFARKAMALALAQTLNLTPDELDKAIQDGGDDTPELGIIENCAWADIGGGKICEWEVLELSQDSLNAFTFNTVDKVLEELWTQLEDVPMDPDTECIEEPFMDFPAGTNREDIWHWFDERYSRGVYHLMYRDGRDRTQDIAQMLYLSEKCFDCETRDCAYNHNGVCRYALVHEQMPEITEEDGCVSGVIDAFADDKDSGIVDATFVSVWDDGATFATACKVNLDTGSVFDIGQVDVGEVDGGVESEYVLINGERYDVLPDEDDNEYRLVRD